MIQESEKDLEARLVSEVKKRGGLALKFTSQFHRGMPDRIVVLPYRTINFIEMKSTGRTPTLLQKSAVDKLRSLGFFCFVIDTTEKLDFYLAKIDKRLARCEAEATGDIEA